MIFAGRKGGEPCVEDAYVDDISEMSSTEAKSLTD
jgi:hypothetical protein